MHNISSSTMAVDIENLSISSAAFSCHGQLAITDHLLTKLQVILGILYMCTFVVAVSGNSLVVYVVMSNRSMQTVTNVFITNLAISDLLVNFTSLWLTPIYTYIGHWIWGGWLCYALPLFQGTSIFISTLTLTAIAIDRYIVIVHCTTSGTRRITLQICIAVITFIWTLSLLLVMPYAVHMRMTYIPVPCGFWLCVEDWAVDNLKSVYGIIVMSLQFVVPFVVIGFCYVRIWTFLEYRHSMVTRRSSELDLQRKRRLLRMLVSMVVIFACSWFPFNALNIMRDFQLDTSIKPIFSFLFLLAHLTSMGATCWNPILYAYMNENFRREFKAALPCFRSERVSQTTQLTRAGSQYRATDHPPINSNNTIGDKRSIPPAIELQLQSNGHLPVVADATVDDDEDASTNVMTMQSPNHNGAIKSEQQLLLLANVSSSSELQARHRGHSLVSDTTYITNI